MLQTLQSQMKEFIAVCFLVVAALEVAYCQNYHESNYQPRPQYGSRRQHGSDRHSYGNSYGSHECI